MADKSSKDAERLEKIVDALEEYITTAPDTEILEAAREEGQNIAQTSERVKALLRHAVKSHQQLQLMAAREGYQRDSAAMAAAEFELPKTIEGKRELFMAAMNQLPRLQPAFTFQNREFKDFSDEDIEIQLRKMALLDLLSKVKLPEKE
jgi:hypothetical protein